MRNKFYGLSLSNMVSTACFLAALLFALNFPTEAQQAKKVRRSG